MADKPLVLTKPNVCAVLERRKFQTRRIINPQPEDEDGYRYWWKGDWDTRGGPRAGVCTHGSFGNGEPTWTLKEIAEHGKFQVGQRAYVAEGYEIGSELGNGFVCGEYLANNKEFEIQLTEREWELWANRKYPYRPTPGRFMYKSLARIFLPIVEVRVERLQDISESDAKAEGIPEAYGILKPWAGFKRLWNEIHGAGAWDLNPWVFCYRWDEIIIKGE